MARRSPVDVPADLRARLEAARLDLLALFRALDRMDLALAEIPQRLIRQLFELDADFAEALWALDQPPGALDLKLMLRDTLAALDRLPEASAASGRTCPGVLIPPWLAWKAPFATVFHRHKPTTWSQAVIPKPVKHPRVTRVTRATPGCAFAQPRHYFLACPISDRRSSRCCGSYVFLDHFEASTNCTPTKYPISR